MKRTWPNLWTLVGPFHLFGLDRKPVELRNEIWSPTTLRSGEWSDVFHLPQKIKNVTFNTSYQHITQCSHVMCTFFTTTISLVFIIILQDLFCSSLPRISDSHYRSIIVPVPTVLSSLFLTTLTLRSTYVQPSKLPPSLKKNEGTQKVTLISTRPLLHLKLSSWFHSSDLFTSSHRPVKTHQDPWVNFKRQCLILPQDHHSDTLRRSVTLVSLCSSLLQSKPITTSKHSNSRPQSPSTFLNFHVICWMTLLPGTWDSTNSLLLMYSVLFHLLNIRFTQPSSLPQFKNSTYLTSFTRILYLLPLVSLNFKSETFLPYLSWLLLLIR